MKREFLLRSWRIFPVKRPFFSLPPLLPPVAGRPVPADGRTGPPVHRPGLDVRRRRGGPSLPGPSALFPASGGFFPMAVAGTPAFGMNGTAGQKNGFIGAITRLRPVATGLRPEKTGLRGVVLPLGPVRTVLMVRLGGSTGAARPVRCRTTPSGPADSLLVAVVRRALRVRRTMLPRSGGSGVRAGSGRAAVAGRGPCARRRRRRSSGGR